MLQQLTNKNYKIFINKVNVLKLQYHRRELNKEFQYNIYIRAIF